jgi:hypothetical protein
LVERILGKDEVIGSTPIVGSIFRGPVAGSFALEQFSSAPVNALAAPPKSRHKKIKQGRLT